MLETLGRIFQRSNGNGTSIVKAETPAISQSVKPLAPEMGVSGLRYSYGVIGEEFHRRLRNKRLYFQDLREMRDNDGMVNACMLPIEMLLRSVKWDVEPVSESNEYQRDAEFIKGAVEDMSHDWQSFISEWCWQFTYGFKPFEICYKQRRGPEQADPRYRSNYTDGLWAWRKWAPRDPESISRWEIQPDGGIGGLYQIDPNTQKETDLQSIEKLLLFQTTHNKNNPEGRSLLRGCYLNWYRKKHIEEMEAIEAERDATGYPVIYVPPSMFEAGQESLLSLWQAKAVAVRSDEQKGMVLPAQFDENGNRLYEFTTVKSAGQGSVNKRDIVKAADLQIAQALMMAWILLGHDAVGSKALSVDQTQTCLTALSGWLESLAGVLNRHAIPRLFALNGWRNREGYPKFKPGRIRPADVEQLSLILKNLAQAGFPVGAEPKLLNHTLREASMPEIDEETITMPPRVIPGQQPPNQNIPPEQNMGDVNANQNA